MKTPILALCALVASIGVSAAQDQPVRGGSLSYVLQEPNTLDCHATTSIVNLLAIAPHYSTLLRISTSGCYTRLSYGSIKRWKMHECDGPKC